MEPREVVEKLVTLDDALRAVTNEIQRALDSFERAVTPPEGHGLAADSLTVLRERVGRGYDALPQIQDASDRVRDHLVHAAVTEALRSAEARPGSPGTPAERIAGRLRPHVDGAREAFEQVGRLRLLVARRLALEQEVAAARACIVAAPETQELLDVVLGVGHDGSLLAGLDPVGLLVDAQAAAESDGQLAGLAAALRALRSAILQGTDHAGVAADVVRRTTALAARFGGEREELRRQLAQLAADAERRAALSRGLFHSMTKASEVLEAAAHLAQRLAGGTLPDGALGPLKAACLEHGILSLLLAVSAEHVDREPFDATSSVFSAALGDLLRHGTDDDGAIAPLVALWDDMAALDPRALEQQLDGAFADVFGLRREAGGDPSVAPERLQRLAAADSLTPWRQLLGQRLDARRAEAGVVLARLLQADRFLGQLPDSPARSRARIALASFHREATRTADAFHAAAVRRLADQETGFARVEDSIGGFRHLEDLDSSASEESRREAVAECIEEIRTRFADLERGPPPGTVAAGSGDDVRLADARAVNETAGARRSLAGVLARLSRLRLLLLPPLSPAAELATSLAAGLASAEPGQDGPRDDFGEALEALHLELQLLDPVELPDPRDGRSALAQLRLARAERLLQVRSSSLVLLFGVLTNLAEEHERLHGEESDAHLSWMTELVLHARSQVQRHVSLLDEVLLDLEDNAHRSALLLAAFRAYHAWALTLSDLRAANHFLGDGGSQLMAIEEPFGALGGASLERLERQADDWRTSSAVEGLIDLLDQLAAGFELHPTLTPIAEATAAMRARAEELKARVLARAEEGPEVAQEAETAALFGSSTDDDSPD